MGSSPGGSMTVATRMVRTGSISSPGPIGCCAGRRARSCPGTWGGLRQSRGVLKKIARPTDTSFCESYPMSALRIFVRRGALRRFHKLKQDAEGLPVEVDWDRRASERRAEAEKPASNPAEQRQSERRREPPFTWVAGEFVVVNEPPASDPPEEA